MKMMMMMMKANKEMSFELYDKLIHTCVMPVLDYGVEVWGIYKCTEVEKVQNTAARVFLGVNKFAPILAIQGEIGWQLCKTRIDISMLRYWNRILKMESNRLSKIVFDWEYELNGDTWTSYIKNIF